MFTGRKPGSFKLWVPWELPLPACVSPRQTGWETIVPAWLRAAAGRGVLAAGPVELARRAPDGGEARAVLRPPLRRGGGRLAGPTSSRWPPGLCFCAWVTLHCGGGGTPETEARACWGSPPPDEEGLRGRCVWSPDLFFTLSLALHRVVFLFFVFFPNYRVLTRLKRNIKSKFVL